MICKHCDANFNFKNKFHEHIREHHVQKFVISFVTSKNSNFRFFTSEFKYKIKKKSTVTCSSVSFVSSIFFATSKSIICFASIFESESSMRSHFSIATLDITSKQTEIASMLTIRKFTSKRVEIATFNCSFAFSFIFFATSRSQIFSAKIVSRSVLSSDSNFPIVTHKITSKSMKNLSINCSFIFSISFFRTFVLLYQKFYLIIDDLIRMFREKFKSFDLHLHQKRRFSSRNIDTFYQSRIIVYFMFAINQKTSISQNLKNSNSKSFQQFTFAKSLSLDRFASVLSEKSIFSLYKKSDIFYISLQSRFSSRFSFA